MLSLEGSTKTEMVPVDGGFAIIYIASSSIVPRDVFSQTGVDDRVLPELAASLWAEIAPYSTRGFVFVQ